MCSFGILGLILAPSFASVPPLDRNLGFGYSSLTKNPQYHSYYMQEAYRIKTDKVLRAWGNGFLVDLFIGIIVAKIYSTR